MVRPMVHSKKHYAQITLSTATTGTRNNETLVTAVESTVANTANEVREGSTIKAVWFEMWAIGTTADQFYTAIVVKLPSGLGNPSFTNMTNLFAYENKKNILYTTQGLTGNDGISIPLPIYKDWIKIPKSKQRFGLGDKLMFVIASRGDATLTYCGIAVYKEYT